MTTPKTSTLDGGCSVSPQSLLKRWQSGFEELMQHFRSFDQKIETLCAPSLTDSQGAPLVLLSCSRSEEV